jgi:DNA transformation protein
MPLSPGFPDYVLELLAGFGKLEMKRMFGGALLSRNGVSFAVLDDDTFFLKADTALGAELQEQGSKPWHYSVKKDGTIRDVAYWSLPDTAADDADEAVALARRSFAICTMTAKAKATKKMDPAKKKSVAKRAAKAPAKARAKK